jgi:hypothetical protein
MVAAGAFKDRAAFRAYRRNGMSKPVSKAVVQAFSELTECRAHDLFRWWLDEPTTRPAVGSDAWKEMMQCRN